MLSLCELILNQFCIVLYCIQRDIQTIRYNVGTSQLVYVCKVCNVINKTNTSVDFSSCECIIQTSGLFNDIFCTSVHI